MIKREVWEAHRASRWIRAFSLTTPKLTEKTKREQIEPGLFSFINGISFDEFAIVIEVADVGIVGV